MGRLKKDLQQIKLSQGQTSPLPLVSPEKEFSTAEQNRRRKMPSLKITFKKSQPEGRFNTCAPSLSMSTLPSTYTTSLSASSYQNSPSSPSRVYLKPKTRKPIILASEKKEAMNLVDLRKKDQLNAWEKPLRMVQRELSETPPLIISLPKDEIYNSESSPETEKPTSSLTNCASVQYCPGGEASKGEKDKRGQNQKTSVTSNHWRAWDRSNSPIIDVETISPEPLFPNTGSPLLPTPPPPLLSATSESPPVLLQSPLARQESPPVLSIPSPPPQQGSTEHRKLPSLVQRKETNKISPTTQLLMDAAMFPIDSKEGTTSPGKAQSTGSSLKIESASSSLTMGRFTQLGRMTPIEEPRLQNTSQQATSASHLPSSSSFSLPSSISSSLPGVNKEKGKSIDQPKVTSKTTQKKEVQAQSRSTERNSLPNTLTALPSWGDKWTNWGATTFPKLSDATATYPKRGVLVDHLGLHWSNIQQVIILTFFLSDDNF